MPAERGGAIIRASRLSIVAFLSVVAAMDGALLMEGGAKPGSCLDLLFSGEGDSCLRTSLVSFTLAPGSDSLPSVSPPDADDERCRPSEARALFLSLELNLGAGRLWGEGELWKSGPA